MEENPPPLAPEALLAQQEWVRRVARALVLDEHRAEDLAQQVWVKVLAAPPRVRVSLRAWLGTVLRRAASDLRRGGARLRAREEAAARAEALPDPAEIVARAETLHRVSAAALALREPYRTVILLRYFEDLAPPEIARRLDVPLETVRTRLRRGLEILREEMDGEGGAGRDRWMAALLPFAVPGLRVPIPGPHPPPEVGSWTGGDRATREAVRSFQEIAAMTARQAAAVSLALLVSVGAALWFLGDMEPPAEAAPVLHAAGGRRGSGPAPAPAVQEPPPPPPPALAPPPAPPPTDLVFVTADKTDLFVLPSGSITVRGRVVDAETGEALAGVPLSAYPSRWTLETDGVTGPDGSFEARGAFRGAWSIGAGHRDSSSDYGWAMVSGEGKPEGDVRLEVRRGMTLEGVIEDADGRRYTGDATVLSWSLDAEGKPIPATQHWVSVTGGTFRLRGLDRGPHLVKATALEKTPVTGSVRPVEAGATGVVVHLPRAAAVEGRLADADGNPVAGKGKVILRLPGPDHLLLRSSIEAEVPGDGTFRSPPLDPGQEYKVEASGFEGFRVAVREGVAGGATDVVVVLAREEKE